MAALTCSEFFLQLQFSLFEFGNLDLVGGGALHFCFYLVIQLVMNGLNIALDLWFVLGLGWGVEGVAWATFIAEWSGLILGLWLCRDVFALPA